jgi:hypothetical protein
MPLGSRSVSIFIVLMLVISLLVNAQDKRQRSIAATETTDSTKQDPKRGSVSTPASVKLVEPPGADFISGEANVAVSGNRNPIIRLGLSPNGATIIEFPSADRLFNIIPGNSNLVTVEESPTKNTDHFIIARPGDGFASPTTMAQARRAPVTSVIVQMQSGLVITFLFYPVQQLAEQAHRVVITYDRNEVEAARRAAGLAVNLDSTAGATKPRTTSLRITTPSDSTVPDEKTSTHATAPRPPTAVADLAEIDTSEPPARRLGKSSDPVRAAGLALTEATRTPGSFKKWSETVHGLSLSVAPVREVNKHSQLVVIAVKNTKKRAARIVVLAAAGATVSLVSNDRMKLRIPVREPVRKSELTNALSNNDGSMTAEAIRDIRNEIRTPTPAPSGLPVPSTAAFTRQFAKSAAFELWIGRFDALLN